MVEAKEEGGWDGKRAPKVRNKGAIINELNGRFSQGVTSWTCGKDMESFVGKKKTRSNAIMSKEPNENLICGMVGLFHTQSQLFNLSEALHKSL
ncbi:hypothetical protein SLE2022_209790 [Rubroshorea leprosula]